MIEMNDGKYGILEVEDQVENNNKKHISTF